jgi:hypothetical protein
MRVFALIAILVAAAGSHAQAEEAEPREREREIDTEHLFGFNTGTDVGEIREREIEGEAASRLGKRAGTYAALAPMLGYEFVPLKDLRVEFTTSFAAHDVSGVGGLDDRRQAAFQGMAVELRYRLLDRERAAFGLAIDAEPHWDRVDETSGAPVDQYGVDLSIFADKELVPDRLIGVLNLVYAPEASRSRVSGEWARDATLGASTGLMLHVAHNLFVGAEARYLRRYDGLGFDRFAGHALFVGPMAFAKVTDHWWLSAALSLQVAGRAVEEAGALDLTNFERLQAKVRVGYNF